MDYTCAYNKSYNKKRLSILIIDDDKDSGELFQRILEYKGHNVTFITDGIEGVSSCLNNSYDLIFLDYHIEHIDGIQVAELIKDHHSTRPAIIAYTGDTDTNTINRFRNIGIQGVLLKPVSPNLIDSIIDEFEKPAIDIKNLQRLTKKYNNYKVF